MFKNWAETKFNKKRLKAGQRLKKLENALNDVLVNMPQEVRDFLEADVAFCDALMSDKNDAAYAEALFGSKKQMIYFKQDFFKASVYSQRYIVAHEIAHVYLGHTAGDEHGFADYQKKEKEADDFAAQYGFLQDFTWSQFFSWDYIRENLTGRSIFLVSLIILVFLWLIFLEHFVFLFRWAVYM
ncbi:ImmA/IrrE family metallo-endopeptidase [Patescibacteria group bacterium]|nr:ImmA/IrrE family metallo-endopeptidase [Patescibacteria group bacterium]